MECVSSLVAIYLSSSFEKRREKRFKVKRRNLAKTFASQSRSRGWHSQPWGYLQWQQLVMAADSWKSLLVQEHKPELNANIPLMPLCIFNLLQSFMPHSWRHAPSLSARIQLSHVTTNASRQYVPTETTLCVFHFWQRFSPAWPKRTCSMITAVQFAMHWWW